MNYVNLALGVVSSGAGVVNSLRGGGFSGVLGIGQGIQTLSSTFDSILGMGREYQQLQNDEQRMLYNRAIESARLDISHHRQEQDIKRQLINMGNVYYDTPTTQTDILEQVNKINDLTDIHLKL